MGNIGSKNRYSYTAMGEDVNLAARLESVPPLYGCLIVCGDYTAQLAQEFLMRELDWLLVKGANKPMAIYQPIATLDAATDAQRELVARFATALEHYRAMRFAEAASSGMNSLRNSSQLRVRHRLWRIVRADSSLRHPPRLGTRCSC